MSSSKNKIESLFQECINLPPREWAAYLDKACVGDDALKFRVLRLLQAHQSEGGFLDAVSEQDSLSDKDQVSEGVELTAEQANKTPRKLWAVGLLVAVVLVCFGGWFFLLKSPAKQDNDFALLPFDPIRSGLAEQSLAKEIHDGIFRRLHLDHGLQLSSSESTIRYLSSQKLPSEIGEELSVPYVLTGDFQSIGNLLRLNVQLIEVESNLISWSDSYSKKIGSENLDYVFKELGDRILLGLASVLNEVGEIVINPVLSYHPEALEEYDKGTEILRMDNKSQIPDAIELFQSATRRDPNFVLAFVALAQAYWQYEKISASGFSDEFARDAMDRAVTNAFALDESLSEVQSILGLSRMLAGDLLGARTAYEKALQVDPECASAFSGLAQLEFRKGISPNDSEYAAFIEEVISLKQKAVDCEPDDPRYCYDLAFTYGYSGQVDQGMELLRSSLLQHPDFAKGHAGMGMYLLYFVGKYDEALVHFSKALAMDPHSIEYSMEIRNTFESLGDRDQALKWTEKMVAAREDLAPAYQADLLLFKGEEAEAIDAYRKTYRGNSDFRIRNRAQRKLLQYDLLHGRYEEARARYFSNFLFLFNENPPIANDIHAVYAMEVAAVLKVNDEDEQALRLINASWEYFFHLSPKDPSRAFHEILMHTLTGDSVAALTKLTSVAESGLVIVFDLEDVRLNPLRKEPEFKTVQKWIAAEKKKQLVRIREMQSNGTLKL